MFREIIGGLGLRDCFLEVVIFSLSNTSVLYVFCIKRICHVMRNELLLPKGNSLLLRLWSLAGSSQPNVLPHASSYLVRLSIWIIASTGHSSKHRLYEVYNYFKQKSISIHGVYR